MTANAQPKKDDEGSKQLNDMYVTLKADLYEVDDAFFQKLAKAKWESKADLAKLEESALPGKEEKADEETPIALIRKQKLLVEGKGVSINEGDMASLLSSVKEITRLPSPEQLKRGKSDAQSFNEGVSLRAKAEISSDRRYVCAKLVEKSLEVEGSEKVNVVVDKKGTEAAGEIVFVKEQATSQARNVPDGGTILVPLQYRPRDAREKDRWLVARVTVEIHIKAEDRLLNQGK
jgi:hypothetical protein